MLALFGPRMVVYEEHLVVVIDGWIGLKVGNLVVCKLLRRVRY